jgi:hypothetical protein
MQEQKPNPPLASGPNDDGHIEDGIPQTFQENSDSERESDLDNEPCSVEDEERILALQARLDAGVIRAWVCCIVLKLYSTNRKSPHFTKSEPTRP